MSELGGLINRVRGRLSAAGIPFVVGGSFALAALGHPRFTQDLDLMVLVPDEALLPSAFTPPEFTRVNEITYQDTATGLYLDLIPVVDDAQRAAFERAQSITLYDAAPVGVLDAEGLVLMLLREAETGDPRKRPLRLRDVELIAQDAALDRPWIEEHARRAGYGAALNEFERVARGGQ